MTQPKTKLNNASVDDFISAVEDQSRRNDCKEVIRMMRAATGAAPKMWGSSIVGFGSYHFVYASGREGDWMLCGFSPRKSNLTIYIMPGFKNYDNLMKKIGKHSTGKSCLYIRNLDDVDREVLDELIRTSVKDMQARYETKP